MMAQHGMLIGQLLEFSSWGGGGGVNTCIQQTNVFGSAHAVV